MKYLPPLHLAASDDEVRRSMCFINIQDGIATATNGHFFVRLNLAAYATLDDVSIMKLTGRNIHRDTWKLLHDADSIGVEGNTIHYRKGGTRATIDLEDDSDIVFPDISSLLSKIANSQFANRSMFALNPTWLMIANKVFNTESVVMRFYEDNDMAIIFPSTNARGFVGIAPVIVAEDQQTIDFSLAL